MISKKLNHSYGFVTDLPMWTLTMVKLSKIESSPWEMKLIYCLHSHSIHRLHGPTMVDSELNENEDNEDYIS